MVADVHLATGCVSVLWLGRGIAESRHSGLGLRARCRLVSANVFYRCPCFSHGSGRPMWRFVSPNATPQELGRGLVRVRVVHRRTRCREPGHPGLISACGQRRGSEAWCLDTVLPRGCSCAAYGSRARMFNFFCRATVITVNTAFHPTLRCRNDAEELGISINDVIRLLQDRAVSGSVGGWQGRKSDQWRYQCDLSADLTLNILVEQAVEAYARIITVREAPG